MIYKTLRVFQCGTPRNALFLEHWSNNKLTHLKDTDFVFLCTQIYIKPIQLHIGHHHNLSTGGFDGNVFQMFDSSQYLPYLK
jgi:hypothetical protein